MPIVSTSTVPNAGAHPANAQPAIIYKAVWSDQAMVTLTTISTRWGPMLLSNVNESTPVIYSSPV
jgi:hypothetical protein